MAIPPFREDGWLPIGHHPAGWDEIVERFGGAVSSRREMLTRKLLDLRDGLRTCGMTGSLLVNGSYVSVKDDPRDFDILLIGPTDIQAAKDRSPDLALLLDAELAEKERGYSFFYVPSDSAALQTVLTFWDLSKESVPKGCVEVQL